MTLAIVLAVVAFSGLVTIIAILDSALDKSRMATADADSRAEAFARHCAKCVKAREAAEATAAMALRELQEERWRAEVRRTVFKGVWRNVPGGSA